MTFEARVKIIGTEIIHRGARLVYERDTVEIDGRRAVYERVRHPGAVVVLPIMDDGRLVLVEQYRLSTRCTLLEAPAGTLEKNELALDCAAREIQEEVGFAAGEMITLGTVYPAPGFCDEVQHFFVARQLTVAKLPGDVDELLKPVLLTVKEFEARVAQNLVQDGKTLAIFLRARVAGLV